MGGKRMSRGLGRLERLILQKASEQPVCLLCKNLADDAATSRKAMARALHSFVRKYPHYALQGGTGRHRALILFDPTDRLSVRWASLSGNSRFPVTKEQLMQSVERHQSLERNQSVEHNRNGATLDPAE
jgi:hypothetical protein